MGYFEMSSPPKTIIWMGSSRKDLKKFPNVVKSEVGFALYQAQQGEKHHLAKPFKGLSGVFEIVSDYQSDTFRAVYAIKLSNDIYVLHAFRKKSKSGIKTPKQDIDIIKSRYKEAQALSKMRIE